MLHTKVWDSIWQTQLQFFNTSFCSRVWNRLVS